MKVIKGLLDKWVNQRSKHFSPVYLTVLGNQTKNISITSSLKSQRSPEEQKMAQVACGFTCIVITLIFGEVSKGQCGFSHLLAAQNDHLDRYIQMHRGKVGFGRVQNVMGN